MLNNITHNFLMYLKLSAKILVKELGKDILIAKKYLQERCVTKTNFSEYKLNSWKTYLISL